MAEFSTVKEQTNIRQVLDMLGVTSLKEGREHNKKAGRVVDVLRGVCPICKQGDKRVFAAFPHSNSYYCWAEQKGGDVLTLASKFWGITLDEAGRRIATHFNISAPRKPAEEKGFDVEAFQKSLNAEAPELEPLGITVDTLKFYNGGYCTKPSMKGKLALPVVDFDGKFSFFMGIDILTQEIHYPKIKDLQLPHFYGIDKLAEGTLHVVAHPLDLLRAVDGNIENVIALLTAITPDVLLSLSELMASKKLETVEFHT